MGPAGLLGATALVTDVCKNLSNMTKHLYLVRLKFQQVFFKNAAFFQKH